MRQGVATCESCKSENKAVLTESIRVRIRGCFWPPPKRDQGPWESHPRRAKVSPTQIFDTRRHKISFTNSPCLPGNPNIYNDSTITGARVCDIIPRMHRSDETRVLPDYFHHAPHFQHFRPLVTRARQNSKLLRYPPESPRLADYVSITLSRPRILAHGYGTRTA